MPLSVGLRLDAVEQCFLGCALVAFTRATSRSVMRPVFSIPVKHAVITGSRASAATYLIYLFIFFIVAKLALFFLRNDVIKK